MMNLAGLGQALIGILLRRGLMFIENQEPPYQLLVDRFSPHFQLFLKYEVPLGLTLNMDVYGQRLASIFLSDMLMLRRIQEAPANQLLVIRFDLGFQLCINYEQPHGLMLNIEVGGRRIASFFLSRLLMQMYSATHFS